MRLRLGSQFFPNLVNNDNNNSNEKRQTQNRAILNRSEQGYLIYVYWPTTNITNVRTDCDCKTWTQCTFLFQGETTLIEFCEEHFHVWAWFCTLFYVLDDSLFTVMRYTRPGHDRSIFALRNINCNVLLVFVISLLNWNCLSLWCFWWMHFIFNAILDSRAFMWNHTDSGKEKRDAHKLNARKQTLFSSLASFRFERNKRTSPNQIAFYIIRHTFSSTRQIK